MERHEPILLSPPDVTELEEQALVRAFRSGWIAPLGPEVDAFETELASYAGRRHAVAVASGTAALHLALLVAGASPGDVVVTSTMTFAATANAIAYTGAEPVFVDCDASGNVDPDLLTCALEALSAEGRAVKAVVPVDFLGKVVDHERIAEVARHHGVPVVVDAAESMGSRRHGSAAASFGAAAAVSFNGNKAMTTSGGGALLTDDLDVAERVRYLASQARQPVPHYEHTEVGFNYRLSNLLAAVGRAQLTRLDDMVARRRMIRQQYVDRLGSLPGITVLGEPSGRHDDATQDNCWLTAVLLDDGAGIDTSRLRTVLRGAGIESRPLWKPMHLQPVYASARRFGGQVAADLFTRGLALPSGSALSAEQLDRVVRTLEAAVDGVGVGTM